MRDIYQKSLDDKENLEEIYTAQIVPIFKKGNASQVSNYRPVALLSSPVKIMEKILMLRINNRLISKVHVAETQYGFTENRSLQMQIMAYNYFVMKKLKKHPSSAVCCLYLDFRKCFDIVNHQILMMKMKKLGISGNIAYWIFRWLRNRKQYVKIGEEKSELIDCSSGVPQGSNAGPQLFKIMVLDLPDQKWDDSFKLLSFADDTKLMRLIKCEEDVKNFQSQLDQFYKWADDTRLQFNTSKFQCVVFKDPKKNLAFPIKILDSNQQEVIPEPEVNDLGIIIQNNLKYDQQINRALSTARNRMYWLLRSFTTREARILIPVYKSMVLSIIDFFNILVPCPSMKDLHRLEDVQRKFTKKLSFPERNEDYTSRLESLGLSSIQRRKDRGLVLFMQKLKLKPLNDLGISLDRNGKFEELSYYLMKSSYGGAKYMDSKSFVDQQTDEIGNFELIKTRTDAYLNSLVDDPGQGTSNGLLKRLRPWI